MWVVKLGGSLCEQAPETSPLPQWLELLAQLGGGRVTLIVPEAAASPMRCGGHRRSGISATCTAHNMALLAMAQTALPAAHGLNPDLRMAIAKTALHEALRQRRTPRCGLPFELAARSARMANTSWEREHPTASRWTWPAGSTPQRLVVVKSCEIDHRPRAWIDLSARGVLDQPLRRIAGGRPAACAIDVVGHRA
jgi:hypothetical protein